MTTPIEAVLVDVSWIDDDAMTTLNHDYRGKNRPTDVLSFAQCEHSVMPAAPGTAVVLGDLVLSIHTAVRQARERRHSLEAESAFLAVHGALHLWGYDHVQAGDRRIMWQQQEAIYSALGFGG